MSNKKGLQKIIDSSSSQYIVSILLGIGLASLFRKSCQNRNCIVFKAPSNQKIQDKIFKFDDKCYTFISESISCNTHNKQINFD